MDGKAVGAADRLRYALGKLVVYAPLRNTLGFSRVRVAYTAVKTVDAGFESMSLDRLLNTSDVVSLHVNLTPETLSRLKQKFGEI